MKPEILPSIQMLRFVAATAIVIKHAAFLFLPHDSGFWRISWEAGVDVFFVVSGFIMVYLARHQFGTKGASTAFLLRRIIRIVPTYFLFTSLMIAALALENPFRQGMPPLSMVATSYAFVPWPRPDGMMRPILSQGWTLNYEAFFYLAFSLSLMFRRGLAFLVGTFVLLVLIHPWLPREMFILQFWSDPIILEFVAGIALALLFARGKRLPGWAALACGAGGILLLVTPTVFDAGMNVRVAHDGLAAVLIFAGVTLGPQPDPGGMAGRAMRLGGDASYALYLSHAFTIHAGLILWKGLGVELPWTGLSVTVGIAIAFALAFCQLVEKPLTNALRGEAGLPKMSDAEAVAP